MTNNHQQELPNASETDQNLTKIGANTIQE